MATPLLTTKLHVPHARPGLVRRPRLLQQLNAGLAGNLTLISAPAGFGKTTLLGEWAAGCGRPVAWVSLEEADNDPARFWGYVIAALQTIRAGVGEAALAALRTPRPRQPAAEALLTGLINDVAASLEPFLLVLDDYHLVTSQAVHDALAFLLDHLPPNMHLAIATRADPPLPLARLRGRGQLTELRLADLRFTLDEAAQFLGQAMGLALRAADIATLTDRTEGWIAGLQMAAASMPRQDPGRIAGFVRDLAGSHRHILDYLMEEVLQRQPQGIQAFLLQTAVLDRLSGPLCDAVTGQADGQATLERLEQANLFIVPLDHERCWYRYHRLFSDLLRKRLGQTSPDLVPALHRRASAWHEQHGLPAAAIDHALAARDFERGAALIEQNAEATLMRSELTAFLDWVGRLPDEQVRRRPTLCFFHAWALLTSGCPTDVVERRLRDVASAPDGAVGAAVTAARTAALRAYVSIFQADTRRAAEICRQALDHLPESDVFLRGIMTWILNLARLADGDPQESAKALQELTRMGQETDNPLIAVTALSNQARLQARQGHLQQAREILEQALQLAADPQGQRLPIASEALIGLGELEAECNELEAAADHLAEAIELARQWSEPAAFDAYAPLARVRLAQGDVPAAQQALQTARELALRSSFTELDDLVVACQEARFLVARGDAAGATRWAEARGLLPDPSAPAAGADFVSAHLRKYEQLVLARLLILQGRAAAALDLLEPLLAQARQLGRIDLTIEIQAVRALACRAAGRDGPALDALAEALSLAEPGGYRRIFLDEGEPLRLLISDCRLWIGDPARQLDLQERDRLLRYADELLASFPGPITPSSPPTAERRELQALPEPLSRRERKVLALLAAGMSNPEIAAELVVAVSTVRSHCKSIYGKLGVHRRWDAAQRARELGLV